ncbi:MAG: ABC transporter substrate-binding protein [Leptolyngbya sp. PLA3]|nr:ABC transporter substrate-binding protein [Leptolyngbya sp. PL-A3]
MLAACSRAPGPGVGRRDGDATQTRLVVLSPALAVILRDLGAGGMVVGRHNYDMVFPELPACGQQGSIDYERVLALEPTDVLIEWGSRPLPEKLLKLGEANSWQVRRFDLRTLEDISLACTQLQGLYAPDRPGPTLREQFEASLFVRPGIERAGRVLLLGAVDPPTVLGPGSFHAQVLERIGGVPAVTEGGPWIELGLEDVLTLAPDAIVLVMPRAGGAGAGAVGGEVVKMLGAMSRLRLEAIERGRVALLDGALYHTPSTAMAEFADDLAEVLERWADSP